MEEQGLRVSLIERRNFNGPVRTNRQDLFLETDFWVFDQETLRPGKEYTLEFRYERYYD